MDDWAWEQLEPWLDVRVELPVGPLFCVVNGPTRGRPWSAAAAPHRAAAASPATPACDDASRPISYATSTPLYVGRSCADRPHALPAGVCARCR